MPNGLACDRSYLPQKPREDHAPTPYARCSRRHLLRLEKWLSLAAFAPRLPSVACRLLPFQEIPSERVVVPNPQSCARSSEEEGGQRSPTDSCHHGLPKCQDHRRIGPPEWLRRPQEHQGAQATSSSGHFRSSALGLRHLDRK